jgi:hypothetical protein
VASVGFALAFGLSFASTGALLSWLFPEFAAPGFALRELLWLGFVADAVERTMFEDRAACVVGVS